MTSPRALRDPLTLLCFLVMPLAALADPTPPALPKIPVSLAVPAGQTLSLTLTAKGVQIYECDAAKDDASKFEWTLKAPEANLFDSERHLVGRHYAGPTWELTNGGKVTGHLKAKADAPDGGGVPWLLLEAVPTDGAGTLAKVQSIQRVSTIGGKPPAESADKTKTGQERRVPYSATYLFYVVTP